MTLVQIKVTSWREMFSSCVSNLMPEDIYINSIFNQIHCLNFFFFFNPHSVSLTIIKTKCDWI